MALLPTHVLLLADIRLYREGLAEVLGRADAVEVVAAVASVDEALRALENQPAEIAIVGLSAGNTLSVCAALARAAPKTRVIALAVDSPDDVLALVEAGVAGYVAGEAPLSDLIKTIESVARGEMSCPPLVVAELCKRLARLAPYEQLALGGPCLTAREHEVFALVEERLTNKEIASALCIEVATVKNHVHNVLEKLQVHRRDEAVAVLRARRSQRLIVA